MQLVVRRVIYRVFRKPRKNVIDLRNELARTIGDVMWRTWNFDECSIDVLPGLSGVAIVGVSIIIVCRQCLADPVHDGFDHRCTAATRIDRFFIF